MRFFSAMVVAGILFGGSFGSAVLAFGQEQKVLHNFNISKSDGIAPSSGLVFDGLGNLYGTTCDSHSAGFGTVFELTPRPGGYWIESILHSFSYDDGYCPIGPLVFDASGNLYGVTLGGGTGVGTRCSRRVGGCGTVFELTPTSNGDWIQTVLYNFDQSNGANSEAGVIIDGNGNLYGTTQGGGGTSLDGGLVFELSPAAGGVWTVSVLHTFKARIGGGGDGVSPHAGLVFDGAGNLYGTTYEGGQYGFGTVFELSPDGDGTWSESPLYSFDQGIGENPGSTLILDTDGNLYGTTQYGGTGGGGIVFELSPTSGKEWILTTLFSLSDQDNGYLAQGSLTFDMSGNLYGAFDGGSVGCYLGCGGIFRLTNVGANWDETMVLDFDGKDGQGPNGSLIFDAIGNLYGTAAGGGTKGAGTASRLLHNRDEDELISQAVIHRPVVTSVTASADATLVRSAPVSQPSEQRCNSGDRPWLAVSAGVCSSHFR